MGKATITPFRFRNPTYIIKAVQGDMMSPNGRMEWPESGSVDDTKNFKADTTCGDGLYGFTIDHIMSGRPYNNYFDCPRGQSSKKYLILEVESSEIVDERNKCKVPRCNVVGCYEADEWQVFCAKWSHLLGDSPPVARIIANMMIWIGRMELTDDLREELRQWVKDNEVVKPGDGCITDAERDLYDHLYNKLRGEWLLEAPSNGRVLQIAFFLQTTSCQAARMALWASLQKNPAWLFAVHPHIEKIMVACASGSLDNVSTHPIRAYAGFSDKEHPIMSKLHMFPKEDQKEIREILGKV